MVLAKAVSRMTAAVGIEKVDPTIDLAAAAARVDEASALDRRRLEEARQSAQRRWELARERWKTHGGELTTTSDEESDKMIAGAERTFAATRREAWSRELPSMRAAHVQRLEAIDRAWSVLDEAIADLTEYERQWRFLAGPDGCGPVRPSADSLSDVPLVHNEWRRQNVGA